MDISKKHNVGLLRHQKTVKFQIDTKYSIIETIGEGAYGVVCSAVDKTTNEKVAIKKICDVFDVPAITKRTLREIKILKHFKHDNIISIKEILKPATNDFKDVYLVLDLMGSDLHHIIQSKQDLSTDHLRFFLYQLLCGLKYIHSANIIHRDLKPSNLLVKANCELKIGDFGMARSLSASPTEQKRVMTEYVATRWYRAPELMLSLHQFTKAIDIWSVGCVFAEMLGRAALFPGSNYLNQLQLILSVVGVPTLAFMSTITSERVRNYIGRLPHKEAVPLAELYPDKPKEAIDLLTKFLVLDPKKRLTVVEALEHPFLAKYHNLDDEPSCRLFEFDLESIPLVRNILKEHILKEIVGYHMKRPKPILTPVVTSFPKPKREVKIVEEMGHTRTIIVGPKANGADIKIRGKHKIPRCGNGPVTKKKHVDTTQSKDSKDGDKMLSDQDKATIKRWDEMQKTKGTLPQKTLPGITPQIAIIPQQLHSADEKVGGQWIINRVNSNQKPNQDNITFTNMVPKLEGNTVTLRPEATNKTKTSTNSHKTNNTKLINSTTTTTMTASNPTKSITIVSAAAASSSSSSSSTTASSQGNVVVQSSGSKPILLPITSLPTYYTLPGSESSKQIFILPNTMKVNAPIPTHTGPRWIAPKPIPLTGVSIRPKTTATNVTSLGAPTPKTVQATLRPKATIACKRPEPIVPSVTIVKHSLDKMAASPGSALTFPSSLSSDPSSKTFSAGSNLSDLSFSSTDLLSAKTISQQEEKEVMANIKQLDEEETHIVNMIDEMESSEPSSSDTSKSSGLSLSHMRSKGIISPCTTVANENTENWSILKNMIVKNSRAKQQREEEGKQVASLASYVSMTTTMTHSVIAGDSQVIGNNNIGLNLNLLKQQALDTFTTQENSFTSSPSNLSYNDEFQDIKSADSINNAQNHNMNNMQNNVSLLPQNNTVTYTNLLNQNATIPNQTAVDTVNSLSPYQQITLNTFTQNQNNVDVTSVSQTPLVPNQNITINSITPDQLQQQILQSSLVAHQNSITQIPNSIALTQSLMAAQNQELAQNSINQTPQTMSQNSIILNPDLTANQVSQMQTLNQNLLALQAQNLTQNHPSITNLAIVQTSLFQNQNLSQNSLIQKQTFNGNQPDSISQNQQTPLLPNQQEQQLQASDFPRDLTIDTSDLNLPDCNPSLSSLLRDVEPDQSLATGIAAIDSKQGDVETWLRTIFVDTPKEPKSGAGGYGLSDLLLSSLPLGDQAPLSASLLNGWLNEDDLDPADIIDLQKELESNSTSLFFDQ